MPGMIVIWGILWSILGAQTPAPDRVTATPEKKIIDAGLLPNPPYTGKYLMVYDVSTQTVLAKIREQDTMHPSSLSKVMVAYIVYTLIHKGQISSQQSFYISGKSAGMGGSRMFLEAGRKVPVMDLLKGLCICSGNDAAVALAEGISGSEEAFAQYMTQWARRDLGLSQTHFMNASGLTHPQHTTTCQDLLTLSVRLIQEYPKLLALHSIPTYTHGTITQRNRNPLLFARDEHIQCDGLKTGYTESGGYGLIGTGVQKDRRIVYVANGWTSEEVRRKEALPLLRWAFLQFPVKKLFSARETIVHLPLRGGKRAWVAVGPKEDCSVSLPLYHEDVKLSLKYESFVSASARSQEPVGYIEVHTALKQFTIPLYVLDHVESLSWWQYPFVAVYRWLFPSTIQVVSGAFTVPASRT